MARKGKDYALFFAVNKYQSPKLTTLQNPISDVKRIAQELQSSYGFQTEVVENPTYETIEKKLEEYNRNFNTGKFDKDGQLLIFFSGHGARQLTNGYFLPSDVNPDDLKRSAFNYKIWRDDMDAIDCKHILVAIDACYSGTFDPKFGMRADGLFGTRAGELTEGQRLIAEHDKHKTRLFFTSGESDQPTPDKSDFAKKFLTSLLSKGYDDGVLTSSEIFSNHLEKAVPRPRTGEFGNDEAGSSFVFVVGEGVLRVGITEGVADLAKEREAWEIAKNKNTIFSFEEFKRSYPKSDFTKLADVEIFKLRKQQEDYEWANTKNSQNLLDFEEFKRNYPQSSYMPFVDQKITDLKERDRLLQKQLEEKQIEQRRIAKDANEWETAKEINTIQSYQSYLTKFPKGDFVNQADRAIGTLKKEEENKLWHEVDRQNTIEAYQKFLNYYPNSSYGETAKHRIAELQPKSMPLLPRQSVEPEMIFVSGGTFQMGNDNGRENEKPVHPVTVSSFYIGKFEVTRKQWCEVMGINPVNTEDNDLPIDDIRCDDIQEYLHKLNEKTGKNYRLPTEAEWEYAARGGNNSKNYRFSGADDIEIVAWYEENSNGKIHQVGSKQSNELGIYDMCGNVKERCGDSYEDNYYKKNPKSQTHCSFQVVRGGSMHEGKSACRITFRDGLPSTYHSRGVGFRLVHN